MSADIVGERLRSSQTEGELQFNEFNEAVEFIIIKFIPV